MMVNPGYYALVPPSPMTHEDGPRANRKEKPVQSYNGPHLMVNMVAEAMLGDYLPPDPKCGEFLPHMTTARSQCETVTVLHRFAKHRPQCKVVDSH